MLACDELGINLFSQLVHFISKQMSSGLVILMNWFIFIVFLLFFFSPPDNLIACFHNSESLRSFQTQLFSFLASASALLWSQAAGDWFCLSRLLRHNFSLLSGIKSIFYQFEPKRWPPVHVCIMVHSSSPAERERQRTDSCCLQLEIPAEASKPFWMCSFFIFLLQYCARALLVISGT